MITDKQYDRLYQMGGKFRDVSECIQCGVCGTKPLLYLYPGEFEYRKTRGLLPVIGTEGTEEVDGDILFHCPIGSSKDVLSQCVDAPLICKLSPIQIFKRPNQDGWVTLEGGGYPSKPCPIQKLDTEWVLETMRLAIELYVNLRVGE